jgi:hypothetical protein
MLKSSAARGKKQEGNHVFSWKVKDESKLVPIFRTVFLLQLAAAITITAGLFLVWWDSEESLSALDLLNKSIARLLERNVTGASHPLLVLWLLCPIVVITMLRAITGILVAPVSYHWLAMITWGAALLALVHFWITFGGDLPDNSPLEEGTLGGGYWLDGAAIVILGLLLTAEARIRLPDNPWATQGPVHGGPVADAERLWRGDYQTCPHCGMLNEPGSRTCYNCQNLLFDFDRKP